ncbi:hypothetical protein NDU88_007132 [Pleurodeles waltl]|uniref:Uncharacterized protein n=1 Tax=Pleurodeles waltl TaxID=8319 RepID=A0AAV7TZK4_PLEWA|nr:hypothetical protein NDU88_007132 [Pleurodeles waltl]
MHSLPKTPNSLHRGEKITARRTGTTQPSSPRGDRRIASVATGTSTHGPLDQQEAEPERRSPTYCEKNQCSACRAIEISPHRPLDRRSSCDFVLHAQEFSASSLGRLNTPQPKEEPRQRTGNRSKAFRGWKIIDSLSVCARRNRRTPLRFLHISSSAFPCREFVHKPGTLCL